MPVACYLKKDTLAYLTGSRIAHHFQAAAKAVRPNISKDEEQPSEVDSKVILMGHEIVKLL
jgi:hypothetical protein